jgi:hypothetical protein
VAQLSNQAATEWRDRLDSVVEVRVLAMVARQSEDTDDPAYRDLLRIDRWEVPVCEIAWRPRAPAQETRL